MKICGFKSVIKEKKSKFNPIASRLIPKTAVNAVNNTGRNLDFPDSIITSFIFLEIGSHHGFARLSSTV